MVNPFLLLAQIGMVLVGLVAIFWWKIKKKVKWKYFAFGALMWVVAILPKVFMDLTVTTPIALWLDTYGTTVMLLVMGLYLGLRTGLFESGLSYLAVKKTKFRKMKLNEAMAFGIGFGSVEAIVLGALSSINIIALLLNPSLLSLLSASQQAALDIPTTVVFAPILERVFTLAVHVFCSLLVVYAVVKKKLNYLLISILFKTLIDGIVPLLRYYFDLNTVLGIYTAEIPVLIIGLMSFYGIKWVAKKF